MIYPDYKSKFDSAVRTLSLQFPNLAWNFRPTPTGGKTELISQWLGDPSEDIMVVCFKGKKYIEKYHKQDFFFINFVCQNGYDVLSSKFDNHLHLDEGDCYIGQPFSGYALKIDSSKEVIMIGLHIKKELFYQHYLYPLSRDTSLFHFFLDPRTDRFSDEYIRLHIPANDPIWSLLYQMLIEYAGKSNDTQAVLRPMMLAVTMHLSRIYRSVSGKVSADSSLSEQMKDYIESHSDSVTLKSLADHFRYHPNYVSRYLHEQTGQTFSSIVLEKRMDKAALLLRNTDLSIEKIAAMLGYSNSSNFYKAFREYYHTSPRDFAK
ncbi:MAG: helix-turn-helix transcriptional regulator [Eubacterium sp.]|jgi:AraC-like DNA-binding protein